MGYIPFGGNQSEEDYLNSLQPGPPPPMMSLASKPPMGPTPPIDDSVLGMLAKSEPNLVDQYRQKMANSDQRIADAKRAQNMGAYVDIAGKALNDFSNASKSPVILKGRMQDLGQAPQVSQASTAAYQPISPMFDKRLAAAKEDRATAFNDLNQGEQAKQFERSNQADDPNSEVSQRAQALAKVGLMGKARLAAEAKDPAAAEAIKNYDVSHMTAREAKEFYDNLASSTDYKSVLASQTAHDVENSRSLDREEAAKMRGAVMGAQRDSKRSADQEKTAKWVGQSLETARGSNPAVIQAEKDIYSADKADSLANLGENGDPNKLSQSQVNLLASEVGKVAQGGTPTMHELEGISPSTLAGRMSQFVTNLTNNPTPANAGAFIKQYQAYTKALRKDAQKVIQDRYSRILDVNKSRLDPEDYNMLNQKYTHRFDLPEATEPVQDPQVAGYAKEHQLDYGQALKILQGRGYGSK